MSRKTKMNSLTSPELLAQVNPNNKQLKKDFLEYLKSIQRSPGTINGYDSDLDIFFVWVLQNANNKDFVKISKRDIIAYQNWLINENENSPARVRRLKAAISSLSNFVENILDEEEEYEGYRSIVRKIENPPMQMVREKTVWEDVEIESLLTALTDKRKYEQACAVALAAYGGRRKAEIVRFKLSDFSNGRLIFDGALYKSSPIQTKGNKYLECYTLAKKFQPYLDNWLAERERKNIDSEWLFPDPQNQFNARTIHALNGWTKSFSNITKKDFYWHSLRHYFVSALSKAGIPDNVVVQILGWSSSEMFNIYNDNSKDEQLAQFFKNGDIYIPEQKSFEDI